MSDDATTTPKTAEQGLRELAEFLDRVVGARSVQIEDLLGNTYTIPSALPARVEARFFRALREMNTPEGQDSPVEAMFTANGPTSWGDALLSMLSDDRLIDAADEAFVSAFPKVIAAARKAAEEAAEEAGDVVGSRPSDLFPMSEVALALTPFVAGALRAAKKVVHRFLPQTPTTTATP